jgi:hypothetical protein
MKINLAHRLIILISSQFFVKNKNARVIRILSNSTWNWLTLNLDGMISRQHTFMTLHRHVWINQTLLFDCVEWSLLHCCDWKLVICIQLQFGLSRGSDLQYIQSKLILFKSDLWFYDDSVMIYIFGDQLFSGEVFCVRINWTVNGRIESYWRKYVNEIITHFIWYLNVIIFWIHTHWLTDCYATEWAFLTRQIFLLDWINLQQQKMNHTKHSPKSSET